jgi:PIN domain nuclease of toxin-antitoxin system
MKLLLDTHILLWALSEPRRLSPSIKAMIANPRNQVFASVVSLFEIAAKRVTSRRSAPALSAARVAELLQESGYDVLDITAEHGIAVETVATFHGDPFDRLILAQALIEGMNLVTHDEDLAAYSSTVIVSK